MLGEASLDVAVELRDAVLVRLEIGQRIEVGRGEVTDVQVHPVER